MGFPLDDFHPILQTTGSFVFTLSGNTKKATILTINVNITLMISNMLEFTVLSGNLQFYS